MPKLKNYCGFEVDVDELEKFASEPKGHERFILPTGGLDTEAIWAKWNGVKAGPPRKSK